MGGRILICGGNRLANRGSFLTPQFKPVMIPVANKMLFWDVDKHSGYGVEKDLSKLEHLKRGKGMLKEEFKQFGRQITKVNDFTIGRIHGDYYTQWKFDNQQMIDDWVVTSDNDNLEGYSKCELVLSKNKTALWKGYIDTEVPKNGYQHKAGYCNITSPYNYKPFKRKTSYDWSHFTHLVVRCRGDGRKYLINISILSNFDAWMSDIYHYALFTRGGPYWEDIEIPFSKFFLAAKGLIQDEQQAISMYMNRIATLGFTLADGVTGPFELEIDNITCVYDGSHSEETAYELYSYPAI